MMLLVTLLCGVPNSVWAAGKIRSVDVYDSNGSHTFPNPDKALSAGETIYIRFRMVNLQWGQTSSDPSYTNPWQFYYTGTLTGDPELDWQILSAVNVPRLGLWVGGRLCEAECVRPQRPELSDWLANMLDGERHYTDLIFSYTIQPGDLALPIQLANASGTGPADVFGGPYYLKFYGGEVPVAIRDSKTQSVTADFAFGPPSLDMDPDFRNDDTSTWMLRARQYENRDLDLSRAGVYAQAIDFDSKFFSAKTGVWRTIAQGSTTAKPSMPTLMIPGGAANPMYYYVWTDDPNVAEIEAGGHVEEVRQYVFGDGMTRVVGKLHVNAGDTNAAFAVKATGEANQVTQVFLSATPTNLYDVAGNLVSNFIARTVRVSHPNGRLYASCTTDNGTYVENDNVKFTVEISEPYVEDMYLYLLCDNPDVSKRFELGAAVVVTNETVAQRRPGLLMQMGTTSRTYTLRTLDNTDYRGCAFTPVFCTSSTYEPEYRIEAYRGESVNVEIQNALPTFRYKRPKIGYLRAVVGEATEIPYRVDDVKADLYEGMSVTMFTSDGGAQTKNNVRASGTFTNVFHTVGWHTVTLWATDKDGGSDSITINYRVSSPNEYDELIADCVWAYSLETNDTAVIRAVTQLPYDNDTFSVPHGALEIPSSLGGWPVSAIDDGVLADSLITSLYVPSSVKEIGEQSFAYCTNLVAVRFAEGVERLGAYAFVGCENLADLDLPSSLCHFHSQYADDYEALNGEPFDYDANYNDMVHYSNIFSPFRFCTGLKNVALPDGMKNIVHILYDSMNGITNIVLRGGGEIRYRAFSNMPALESVTIPSSVTNIGDLAFYSCFNLTRVDIAPDGLKAISQEAFGGCENLAKMQIPVSLENIGARAFGGCAFERIVLPDGLKEIGGEAFEGLRNLTHISIPQSVTNVGVAVFKHCRSLTSIAVPQCMIDDNGYGGMRYFTSDVYLITNVVIQSGTTNIGESAFQDCGSLTSIDMPQSVVAIGASAFRDCNGLCSLRIPAGVKSIGIRAFAYCRALENVIMLGECPSTSDNSAIYEGCSASLVTIITSRWTGPMDEWQQRPVLLDGIVARTSGDEEVVVGVRWINDVLGVPETSYSSNPTTVISLLNMPAANGKRTIAECYALGIDPEDPNDDLTITDFKMENGIPVITLNHSEDGSGNSFMSRVKTLGKSNLADAEWLTVPADGNPVLRFFKVVVEVQ